MRLPNPRAVYRGSPPEQPRVIAPGASASPLLGTKTQPSIAGQMIDLCSMRCDLLPEPARSRCMRTCSRPIPIEPPPYFAR
jgi:hypothetical protein